MRALPPRGLPRTLMLAVLVTLTWSAGFVLPTTPAAAQSSDDPCASGGGDPEDEAALDEAIEDRKRLQAELNEILDTGELLVANIEQTTQTRDELVERQRAFDAQAGAAADEVAARIRRSYMLQPADPVLGILSASDAADVVEQSHVLSLLAEGSRARTERAASAARRTDALAEHAQEVTGQLREMESEYAEVEQRTARLLDEAKTTESQLSAKVAQQRAENAARCPLPPGQLSGGLACPVDQPRSYSDTYGAPRSGGRAHKGVDILAPHGTPIRAFENGRITRMNSGGLGGISLYMMGDSGNQYYYTHLSGYVSGVSTGDRVVAGQHIAYNGDTGNARGIPHLHWEVRPGGGGNVNPYPYAYQACG